METDKKKNALAEIATELKSGSHEIRFVGGNYYVQLDDIPAVRKAREIIEELAKVQIADGMSRKAIARGNCLDYKCNGGFPETVGIFTTEHFPKWICSAVNAIEKCREIAKKK